VMATRRPTVSLLHKRCPAELHAVLSDPKRTTGIGAPEPRWPDVLISVAMVVAVASMVAWWFWPW
jgi:hypothetical protein